MNTRRKARSQTSHSSRPRSNRLYDIFADAMVDIVNGVVARSLPMEEQEDLDDSLYGGEPLHVVKNETSRRHARYVLLAFPRFTIKAGETIDITTRSQIPLQPLSPIIEASFHGKVYLPPLADKNSISVSIVHHDPLVTEKLTAPVPAVGVANDADAEALRHLYICDFRIGKNSQFPNGTPVPASFFVTAFEKGRPLTIDKAQVAMDVSAHILNTCTKDIDVGLAFHCEVVD